MAIFDFSKMAAVRHLRFVMRVWIAYEGHLVKVKVGFLYSSTYMVDQEQRALTISEVAVDWQEPMVLQRKCGHPLPALTDIGPAVAASKHTTAPINHTMPSSRKNSPDATTPREMAEPGYCLLLIYRTRKDADWPSWIT